LVLAHIVDRAVLRRLPEIVQVADGVKSRKAEEEDKSHHDKKGQTARPVSA